MERTFDPHELSDSAGLGFEAGMVEVLFLALILSALLFSFAIQLIKGSLYFD